MEFILYIAKRIIQAIPILDHIIIGKDKYYSMADNLELFL